MVLVNMDTKALCRTTFHLSAFVLYLWSLITYEFLPPVPHKRSHEHFAGRFKYLTYWNLIMQCVFFGFCVVVDFAKSSQRHYGRLVELRDKMYASIALPYGMFVTAVFWVLFAINRDYIYPKILETIIPSWLNHVSHTVIFPVLLVETSLLKHHHPPRNAGFALTMSFGAIYILWVLFLALVMDIWPYPILEILTWGMRVVFFVLCFFFLSALYVIGETVNYCVWGQEALQKAE